MKKVDQTLAMDGDSYGAKLSPEGSNAPEPQYPSFHYEGNEELHIPAHGTMVVHYCVTRVVETTTKAGEHYACDVQIKRIISAEEERDISPTRRDTDTEDALDKLARENMAEHEEEE